MMDKAENLFNLTNYRDHPENKDYRVFFHYNMEQAEYFKSLLDQEAIEYEAFLDVDNKREVMLFGVHKRDFRKALLQNDMSYAKHKKRFIPNNVIRNTILIITLALFLFALIGYMLS